MLENNINELWWQVKEDTIRPAALGKPDQLIISTSLVMVLADDKVKYRMSTVMVVINFKIDDRREAFASLEIFRGKDRGRMMLAEVATMMNFLLRTIEELVVGSSPTIAPNTLARISPTATLYVTIVKYAYRN